jgi:hypothetical protein
MNDGVGEPSMKTKHVLSIVIFAAFLTGGAAQGQQPEPMFPRPSPITPMGATAGEARQVHSGSGLSDWILYRRECCEGPFSSAIPLYGEFYLQAGPSVPVGGITLDKELQTGWSIAGGLRVLFFNEPQTRAWVVDNGTRSDQVLFEGVVGRQTFSIQSSNRTMVGLGLGHNWYLGQPANSDVCHWRFGVDGGGRWGSHRINFNEFGHVTDVIGAIYAGAHADVEIPWRQCIFQTGVRLEWAYTWSDILQQTSDVSDISVFFTAGVRW